jgi:hypothetical protein
MNPASSVSALPPPSSPQSADFVALSSATNWPSAPTAWQSADPQKMSSAVPFGKSAAVLAPLPSAAPVKLLSAVPVSMTGAVTAPLPSAALSAVPVQRTAAVHAVLTSAVPTERSVPQLESHPSEARALGRQVSIGSNITEE